MGKRHLPTCLVDEEEDYLDEDLSEDSDDLNLAAEEERYARVFYPEVLF